MSNKGVKKHVRFCALHEQGEWRSVSKFESIDYALNNKKRGVLALFNGSNDYLNGKEYSLPLFAIIWDETKNDDAYVYRKNKSTNKIESRRIGRHIAEVCLSNQPEQRFLNELFDDHDSWNLNLSNDLCSILLLEDSERESIIKARIGQGKFRRNVIDVWGSEVCALTLTPVKEMLIASHIKAWRNCDDTTQRLDGANGILLCSHIDRLFDQHLITFRKVGSEHRLRLSNKLDKSLLKKLGVVEGCELTTTKLRADDLSRFEGYLEHHQKIFDQLNIGL
ncbi:HNH endonuclease [Shewanella algae]|uniref:HNH endonuclease n=1 Tax=Shewanella algae TaxID=38313 RepID=UPI001AAE6C7A|nr:HNH endonuclease signature motif containing protein [Shewanella algae]MBO2695686.1 HNH endonuclease [Shewanella algae]